MNLNDLFFKGILVLLLVCIMTCMYYCHSHINNSNNSNPQLNLTENEKQVFKEYFSNPKMKDEQDRTYIDSITDTHAKNIEILMKEINKLNAQLAAK